MKWLNVSDHPTKDEQVFLVRTANHEITMAWRYTDLEHGVRWFDVTHGKWLPSPVTHRADLTGSSRHSDAATFP